MIAKPDESLPAPPEFQASLRHQAVREICDRLIDAVRSGTFGAVPSKEMTEASLSTKDRRGRNLFHWACKHGYLNQLLEKLQMSNEKSKEWLLPVLLTSNDKGENCFQVAARNCRRSPLRENDCLGKTNGCLHSIPKGCHPFRNVLKETPSFYKFLTSYEGDTKDWPLTVKINRKTLQMAKLQTENEQVLLFIKRFAKIAEMKSEERIKSEA